ncbi:hypothetical protein [Paracraurococcus ruber]|uniref:DUF5666 domain-containing protein n=1 Tax=Paracraurococcus ruber TaxID=77675 RepID=A0ABS1CRC6_9PROT|nr:hypothetical protein [Paracraurococcus ruber]MBK1656993.1 hypothetical protein [Paracraurococcus ruber]TDG34311.1 hypothetical protein E2C05_00720 [Paracraurococcus ruber]
MTSRRGLLLAGLLAGCARLPGDEGGIGGTGGIAGGDGKEGEEKEGGIGGTGLFAAGLFGTLAMADGRLAVAGVPLGLAPGALRPVRAGLPPLPGETVVAEAVRGREGLRARRIAAFLPLVGPLEALPGGGFGILGTRLEGWEDAPLRDAEGRPTPVAALQPGQRVAASGIWNGATLLASAVRLLPPGGLAELRGQVRTDPNGVVRVGGTRVVAAGPETPPPGSFVVLRGEPWRGGLAAWAAEVPARAVFSNRVSALAVEGVLAPNPGAPGYHLSGFGLPVESGSPVAPRPGQRRLLLGRYGGAFRVAEAVDLPEAAEARDRALAAPAAEAAIRRWLDSV